MQKRISRPDSFKKDAVRRLLARVEPIAIHGATPRAPGDRRHYGARRGVRLLADAGIDSISVTSDALPKVLQSLPSPATEPSSPERPHGPALLPSSDSL
jgi:hypothetical protein